MAGNANEIAIGPGWLYVAPIGTAEPVANETALPVTWLQVGYTEEGSTFAYNVTSEDVFVAEETSPVSTQEVKAEGSVKFALAQANRKNFGLALGLGTALTTDATSLEPASLGGRLFFMMIWDKEAVPTTANVRHIYRKCFSSGGIELVRKKAPNKTTIGMEAKLYTPTGAKPFIIWPSDAGMIS
jgi:hypothetical protein